MYLNIIWLQSSVFRKEQTPSGSIKRFKNGNRSAQSGWKTMWIGYVAWWTSATWGK